MSRVISEPLGGSALSQAVQDGRLPLSLQPWRPSSSAQWSEHVERQRPRTEQWAEALRPAIAASGPAAARLDTVIAARGVLVTTGQQAALFGGPQYTLAKALTALALADAIQRETGVPAAPVFWAATDDADFLEASVAHVADAEGLRELRLASRPPAGTMMSAASLRQPEVQVLLGVLRRACGSAAHAEYLDMTRAAFSGRATLGGAYVALMRALLEPLGIAVFDSSHEAYRAAARPLLAEALTNAGAIALALTENAAAIRAAGFEPQVLDDRGMSLVFEVTDGTKRRIGLGEAAAARRARALSPNVLLRPLTERELMPTVAYVGGPGEIAYFTQANAVAAALNRPPLVVVPRWSCTIIEPHADRALRRLGVDWQEVKDVHALERRLAVAALPADLAAAWRQLRERVHAALRDFAGAARRHDLLDPPVLDGLERTIDHKLSRAERRLLAAARRRDERARRDLAVASAALFPLGSRQERVLNFIPMLARGGGALLDAMGRAAGAHASTLVRAARPERTAAV